MTREGGREIESGSDRDRKTESEWEMKRVRDIERGRQTNR